MPGHSVVTMGLEFAMQRFAQTQHVGLGGSIDGKVLHALVGQQAGHQQNLPASACSHVLGKYMGDRSQARHIQLQHCQCRVQLSIDERTLQSMAGVVDQDVDGNALVVEALMQLEDCCNVREISWLHHDLDAVLPA
jgi:hypothetical protein